MTAAEVSRGTTMGSDTITAAAPFPRASETKACPSWFSPGRAMKQSPGAISRVSVEIARTCAAGSPESISPPAASASVATVLNISVKILPDHQPVVKCMFEGSNDLVGFVTLAPNKNRVSGTAQRQGEVDGLSPVNFPNVALPC